MVVRVFSVWAVVLILSCGFLSSLEADILKSVDDDGAIYYSDQPLKGIDYEWVDEGEKSYFFFEPTNELKNKKAQVLPPRRVLPKPIQQQKKIRKDVGETLVEGAPARRYPSGRISTDRTSVRTNSGSRSTQRIPTKRASVRGNSSSRTSTERTSTKRTSGRGSSSRRASSERTSTR